ncbi:MAG: type II toxin-antitoxin system prevent-host-death family antitoxin [Aphanocapsa sp. GSE-SYN-MK-11-07L]|jgi:antitoxin YefM|nr:type II toxin-antitoxin system prevent-host-death family antitoxin [Aphanocapsa sp. GSE-SYN-MK-11-07L]
MIAHNSASPTEARKNFFSLLEQVANDHEIVIVNRRNGENVALIAESDLASLYESAYLLKSPANAQRLLGVLERSKLRDSLPVESTTTNQAIAQLKQELTFEQAETEV